MILLKSKYRFTKEILTNIFVFLGLLFALARIIRGIDNLYVLALLSFGGIFFLNYKKLYEPDFKKILIWFLPFGVWACLTAIWSLEPFISFSRGLFYIFIISTAVLIGFTYTNKSRDLFKLFLILNGLIVVISIFSLISGIPSDAWTANHGMGFTSIFTHQNTLAAVLMFTLIGPVYFLLNACPPSFGRVIPNLFRNPQKQMLKPVQHDNQSSSHSEFNSESKEGAKKKGNVISNLFRVRTELASSPKVNLIVSRSLILLSILIILNFYFIYLSYSRSVMLALFVGGTLLIYLLGTLKTNLIFTLFIIISGASVFYFFGNNINTYLKKGGSDYFARRNILWEPSSKAALNGGIIGLGYGVTDPTIESNYRKVNRFKEIKREKGNSILALIEETGIIGLALFLLPVFILSKNYLFKRSFTFNFSTTPKAGKLSLLFSFLLMFLIHAQFEAWFVGVSSFYLFVFSILLANILGNKYEPF